jgi:radical SAM protein with 4Fe4S-binding SPASM domain
MPFGGKCALPNWNMTTYWNGDVVLCCQDTDGFSKIGNVMEKSIKEIWDSSLYEKYRRSIHEGDFLKNPLCERCIGADG